MRTAPERLARLLSIVPWVVANNGPTVAEVCARFDIAEQDLVDDLNVVFTVGIYPYTPDEMIDVVFDEDCVWIHYAEYFQRPLRLTPEQGLALTAAGAALLGVPGADGNGPLARALEKVATVLGVRIGESLDIRLGDVSADTLEALRTAVEEEEMVEIDYYSFGRDTQGIREIEPWRVFVDQGQWYLRAWCNAAGAERLFRIDRIAGVSPLGQPVTHTRDLRSTGVFDPDPADPRVWLELTPESFWVCDQYPIEEIVDHEDGTRAVRLAVTAEPWMVRLLLRLGPTGRLIEGPAQLEAARQETTDRLLARYRT